MGIHYSEINQKEDLVYSFSNFYSQNGLSAALDNIKATPLIGPDASTLGPKLYMRGTTWDVKHMDKFINSSINKRLS